MAEAADTIDDVGDVSKLFDIKDVNSFRDADIHDVEKYLDSTLKGYTKAPLKRGDGVRYFDGRGNSWQLNYGYSNATDKIHGGPYLKTTVGEEKVRIPLKGSR